MAETEGADSEIELLCIGNALIDVFAQVEEGFDLRYGLKEKVQHIPITQMREILSVLPEFNTCSGGGAANTAKIAGLLGIKTSFIGALGAAPGDDPDLKYSKEKGSFDQFGRLFEKQLEDAGVKCTLLRKLSPTGVCLMLQISSGDYKIAAAPSAALELSREDLNEEQIRRAKVVVLDGFLLGRKALVHSILEISHKYGTVIALDVSSTGLAAERTVEIITYARLYPLIIFMNEDEAKAFYRTLSKSNEQEKKGEGLDSEIISFFKNYTSQDIFPVITIKLGVRGAIVFANGNIYREETIPVIPLETTGAGDAFSAAFLAAWIRNKPLSQCAALGNKAAREVLDSRGSQADPKALKNLGKQLKL